MEPKEKFEKRKLQPLGRNDDGRFRDNRGHLVHGTEMRLAASPIRQRIAGDRSAT